MTETPNRGRRRACPATSRMRFPTWDEAAEAALTIKLNAAQHHRVQVMRPEYCGACHGHHLTARPERRTA